MQAITKRFKQSEFLRHNAIMFGGSLAVSAVNYLYYPVLGRLLPVVQFGEVQVLATLFAQSTLLFGVFTNVAVNIVSNERDDSVRNRMVYELERFAGFIVLLLVGVALLFIKPLQSFFQFPELAPFLALGLVLIASAPLAMRNAYLRGRQAFGKLSTSNLIASGSKLIASVLFVLIGFGTIGAIGGLLVAEILALFYARRHARMLGLKRSEISLWRRPDLKLMRPYAAFTLLVFIVSMVTTALYSFDTLIIKRLFSPEDAGLYAGISTVARIIYFLTGSFAMVLLSSVRVENTPKTNHNLLLRSAGLQMAIGGSALVAFVAAPWLVIKILVGSKYLPYANLLPLLATALFVLALVGLFLNYDIALRRWSAAVVAVLGAITMAFIVYLHHASVAEVVQSVLWGSLAFAGLRACASLCRRIMPKLNAHPSA